MRRDVYIPEQRRPPVLEDLKKLNEKIDRTVGLIEKLKNCMNCKHCVVEEGWRVTCTEDEHPNMREYVCDSWEQIK